MAQRPFRVGDEVFVRSSGRSYWVAGRDGTRVSICRYGEATRVVDADLVLRRPRAATRRPPAPVRQQARRGRFAGHVDRLAGR